MASAWAADTFPGEPAEGSNTDAIRGRNGRS